MARTPRFMLYRPVSLDLLSCGLHADAMTKRLLNLEPIDALGEVLHTLRMTGTFYCRSELTAPWGLSMPAAPGCLWFHMGLVGECRIQGDDFDEIKMTPGTFVLVTRGGGHWLATDPDVTMAPVMELPYAMEHERYALLRYGGGGQTTTLVCGIVSIDHEAAENLVQALPPVIHLDSLTSLRAEWMQSTIRLMAAEAQELLPGGETIVTRLADVLVVQAIRHWLRNEPAARSGWIGALRDPVIGRALALIHREPGEHWTVASLAARVAMSRSAFAARFVELVGEAPMRYVGTVRMGVARKLLERPGATVADVAGNLGYGSEAAFSRAFKRITEQTPGSVRQRAKGRRQSAP